MKKYAPEKSGDQGPSRAAQPSTRPPAAVVRSFKATAVRSSKTMGSLQLHRLVKAVSFRCATCRKRKKEDLIAIMDQDWKFTVCNACYDNFSLRAKAKKTREPARLPPKKVKRSLKQRGEAPARLPTARQSPGAASLLKFFRDAGIDVQLGPTGQLWVDGGQVGPLVSVPPPEKAEWINLVNEIALTRVRDKFIRSVADNSRFGEGLSVSLLHHEKGVAVVHSDERLAVIHPAHASIPQRPFVYANFLTAGPHWQQVATILHEVEAERAARLEHDQEVEKVEVAKNPSWRLIDHLPGDLSPDLINACLDASRRIRLERQLDYGDTPVVLKSDDGVLTLLPIAGTETGLPRVRRNVRSVVLGLARENESWGYAASTASSRRSASGWL